MIKELSSAEFQEFECNVFKYFEMGDVTRYGAIINRKQGAISDLPTRGRPLVQANDVVFAKDNSSRGTTVIIPESFDGALVTTVFLAIRRSSQEESLFWLSVLSSEAVRKPVYYLAVSASQPEIRPEIFRKHSCFPILLPPIEMSSRRTLKPCGKHQSNSTRILNLSKPNKRVYSP